MNILLTIILLIGISICIFIVTHTTKKNTEIELENKKILEKLEHLRIEQTAQEQNLVLLKNNSFRVRSERVLSELDTWVFKNGRPDHMDGMHDDLLTCLAMGLFVAQYYMLKTDKIKQKDTCIVQSWYINNSMNTDLNTKHLRENVNI